MGGGDAETSNWGKKGDVAKQAEQKRACGGGFKKQKEGGDTGGQSRARECGRTRGARTTKKTDSDGIKESWHLGQGGCQSLHTRDNLWESKTG